MPLKNIGGGSTGQTFTLKSTNKASFERALRTAVDALVGADASIMGARFVFVRDVGEIAAAIRSGNYTQVVYYGHADQNTSGRSRWVQFVSHCA